MGIDQLLTSTQRRNLNAASEIDAKVTLSNTRLTSGKAVNTATDDPYRYFTAQALDSRAAGLSGLLDNMSQASQTLKSAGNAITALSKLVDAAKGKISQAELTEDPAERAGLAKEYTALLRQMEGVANDASYKGKNLLAGDGNDLRVTFDDENSAYLDVRAVDYRSASNPAGLALNDATNAWQSNTDINAARAEINQATNHLRQDAATFGTNQGIIENRGIFAKKIMNTLSLASTDFVAANLSEEGASLLALRTQQQVATSALSLSNDADNAILRLFGG